jgi:hypothetical protein
MPGSAYSVGHGATLVYLLLVLDLKDIALPSNGVPAKLATAVDDALAIHGTNLPPTDQGRHLTARLRWLDKSSF